MVDSSLWWEFVPGQRVMTREGIAGTVQDVQDGPGAGNETYLVSLDAGLGGGEYGASELTALPGATAVVEQTAAADYPELGTILSDRPPLAHSVPATEYRGGRVTAGRWVDTDRSRRLEGLAAQLLTEANADRWRPEYPGEPMPYAELPGGGIAREGVGSILASVSYSSVPHDMAVYHILPKDDPHAAAAILRREIAARRSTGHMATLRTTAGHYRDAIQQHGGFTVRNHLGDAPASGFMVSPYKDVETKVPDTEFDDRHVAAFQKQHADKLAHPDAYLGAWHHEGNVYLDVSHHLDSEDKAHELARKSDQIAIYNLGTGEEIPTRQHQNVAYLRNAPGQKPVHAMMPIDASAADIRTALGLPPR